MSALPIDPTQVELAARVVEVTGSDPEPPAIVRAAFEAGIEAERARCAVEGLTPAEARRLLYVVAHPWRGRLTGYGPRDTALHTLARIAGRKP